MSGKPLYFLVCSFIVGFSANPGEAMAREPVYTFAGHTAGIRAMAVSPDGSLVAAGATQYEKPGEIRIWDVSSGKEVKVVRIHPVSVSGLSFSPDGKFIASGGFDNCVRVSDVSSGSERASLACGASPWEPWFLPDGKSLLVMEAGGPIVRWNLSDLNRPEKVPTALGRLKPGGPANASPDRTRIALGYNLLSKTEADIGLGNIGVYDVATGKRLYRIRGPEDARIECVVFSPDGRRIAAGYHDNCVRIWDAEKDGEPVILTGPKDFITCLAFSPKGNSLVAGDYTGAVFIWDLGTGKTMDTFRAHEDVLSCLGITPNSSLLLTASHDKTVKSWRMPLREH